MTSIPELTNKKLLKEEVKVPCVAYEEKAWYEKLQFKLWGGEPYDTPEKLQKFIRPHKVIMLTFTNIILLLH